tara:strand:+ start:6926 stop:7279 length:354 start_codon:yes stop_codon:yes gene_type:complete
MPYSDPNQELAETMLDLVATTPPTEKLADSLIPMLVSSAHTADDIINAFATHYLMALTHLAAAHNEFAESPLIQILTSTDAVFSSALSDAREQAMNNPDFYDLVRSQAQTAAQDSAA